MRRRSVCDRLDCRGLGAISNSVTNETHLAETFEASNRVCTHSFRMARRIVGIRTFVTVDTSHGTVREWDVWFAGELKRQVRSETGLTVTFELHWWKHIHTDGATRTRRLGLTLINWMALFSGVSVVASASTQATSILRACCTTNDTKSVGAAREPAVEGTMSSTA